MLPYQLSAPTTCQPMGDAFWLTSLARPFVGVLLKTSTMTFLRTTGFGAGFGVGFALGVVDGVGVAVGCCATVAISRSAGSSPRVAKKATPAITTATMLSIIT